jgi:4'-phosphopantetheinyl transferase
VRASVVDLWWTRLDAAAAAGRDRSDCLSADELARAARFVSAADGARFVAARAFLRHVLAGRTGTAPQAVRFRYGAHGKPALDETPRDVRFSLAHAGNVAACAVTAGPGEVGVDIEHVRPLRDLEGLARVALARGEMAHLTSLPAPARLAAFFEAWTRKEAVLKAVGCGLAWPLDGLEVAFGPGQPARLLRCAPDPGAPERFSLQAFELDGIVGAVALDGDGIALRLREWAWD